MADYPVTFSVIRPEKFERPQLFLRIIVYFIFSFVGGFLYLGFPVLAAIWISQKGSQKFLEEDGPRITGWLRWIIGLYAYLYILTDRFPSDSPDDTVRFDLQVGGNPTLGSALLRLIYSIPSAIILGVLSWVSAIVWVIAAVQILLQEKYSDGLYDFQCGVVRWNARLLGYHASLVEPYPPFAFDTGAAPATAG
jgi:hypothetical protein